MYRHEIICAGNTVWFNLTLLFADNDVTMQWLPHSGKFVHKANSGAVFTMQNVLPRSGARAYTVSDDASADQCYLVIS